MFGPLATTFHSNAPQLMTVPAAVVYSAAVNLSLDRWTAVFKQEGVEVRGLLVFLTWNLPFFSTFVRLWARYGERDMYAYVSWCTVQLAALFANSELVKNFYEPTAAGLVLARRVLPEPHVHGFRETATH
ncbi:uncharacterized protein LOC125946414 [Dermacentor silvarum]|uniref:uncharacterized protein LOC125946414 n=1 Tax=Dermacentor silvarum TaxID=543639 RepID=UPI00210171D0|nr:uncharacterized protein LOC125946414 [Dermacentor silvarum]